MIYAGQFLISLTITINVVLTFVKGNCPPPPTIDGTKFYVVVEHDIAVYICNDNKEWSTGDTIMKSTCVNGEWMRISATCSDIQVQSCADSSSPPQDSPLIMEEPNLFQAYNCSTGKRWLSGRPARLMQCRSGSWTNIWDICDEACDVPRDCTDVANLNLTKNENYNVIPSGDPNGEVIQVYCLLESDDVNGNGWTYIFKNDLEPTPKTIEEYINGYGDCQVDYKCFTGLNYLSLVSKPTQERLDTSMVMEVLFLDDNKKIVRHAAYGNVSFGPPPGYRIKHNVTYHGDAGDGLCIHLNTDFTFPTDATTGAAQWWGANEENTDIVGELKGSFLSKSAIEWSNLQGVSEIKRVEIRVRRVEVDAETLCPPIAGSESWWMYTSSNIEYSRVPGTLLTWECLKPYFMEGEEGGKRTHFGTAECQAGEEGGPPSWNTTVTLPCALTCPGDFNLTEDRERCMWFSNTKAEGFVKASRECLELNSTLAVMKESSDTNFAAENIKYFANHAKRGTAATDLKEAIPETPKFNCSNTEGTCDLSDPPKCTVIMAESQYEYVDCKAEFHFACEIPGWCPEKYEYVDGACYKIVNETTTFQAALKTCLEDGAGLAYPTTSLQADRLAHFVIKQVAGGNKVTVFTGVNSITPEGFDLSILQVQEESDESKKWYTMDVDNTSHIFTAELLDASGPTTAVCQYPGPMGCSDAPPVALDNMIRFWSNNNSTDEDTTVTYTCDYGYFVEGNKTVVNQTLTCLGMLGEWYPSMILPCIRVEVCEKNPTSGITVEENAESFYLGGNMTYKCPSGMAFQDLSNNFTTVCTEVTPSTFAFNPAIKSNCTVCLDFNSTRFPNATSDWSESTNWTVGDIVSVTCDESFEHSYKEVDQNVSCTEKGWDYQDLKTCYKVCGDPPPPGDNVVDSNITINKIGEEFTYNCTPGYYFTPSDEDYPNAVNQTIITCNESTLWESNRGDASLSCIQFCKDPPPSNPKSSNSTWEGKNEFGFSEDTVTYTCFPDHKFPDFSDEVTATCNGTHWLPEMFNDTFICHKVCPGAPPETAAENTLTRENWTAPHGWVNETVTYKCDDMRANKDGNTTATVLCTEDGWTTVPEDFLCEKICFEQPPAPSQHATSVVPLYFQEGAKVEYNCKGGFRYTNTTDLISECMNQEWTLKEIPQCLLEGIEFIQEPGIYDEPYTESTDFLRSDFQDGFQPVSEPASEVNGPYGFGIGTGLRSTDEHCMKMVSTKDKPIKCLSSPIECKDSGISFSIWEKPLTNQENLLFSLEVDNKPDDRDEHIYLISTGGDDVGHPGISVSHRDNWLTGIVSTGKDYWKVRVFGAVRSGNWNNVGLTWNITNGLKLYINDSLTATKKYSDSAPAAKEGIKPSELMVGCHKDKDNEAYRGFNEADVDEFAVWLKTLDEPDTKLMLGGYSDSPMSSKELLEKIENVDLADPKQQSAVVGNLNKMTAPTADTDCSTSEESEGSTPTSEAEEEIETEVEADMALKDVSNTLKTVYDENKLPDSLEIDVMEGFLKSMVPLDNVLSARNSRKWKAMRRQDDVFQPVQLINQFAKYEKELLKRTNFPNGTEPFCNANAYKNLLNERCMSPLSEFRNESWIVIPNYNLKEFQNLSSEWNSPYDRVAFPTIALPSDEICENEILSLSASLHKSASDYANNGVNRMDLDPRPKYVVDSSILSVYLTINPHRPQANESELFLREVKDCVVDHSFLKDDPIRIKLEHKAKVSARRRKLHFHEHDLVTDIEVRRCARWNEKYDDFGVWDTMGCLEVETTSEYTTCVCDKLGTYAVIAEKMPKKIARVEPLWLTITKYILYGISAFAVVFYILVVAISSDLKDQFHLMGLNLGIAILGGSCVLVLSDFDTIRSDRHLCTAIGALIHFFYGAVGFWMLALGHASFKAITGGVIGERLEAYSFLAWGMALTMMGVPFVKYLHDLGTDPTCFISWDDEVKMTFFIPQLICSCAAFLYGVIILCNLSTPALRKENLIDDYGSFCRGAGLLVVLLSLTWIFAFLAYVKHGFLKPDFYPIFQVLNSIAGICLLVLIGIGSNRFRMFCSGQAKIRRQMLNRYAFGLPGFNNEDDKSQVKHLNADDDEE